MFSDVVEWRDCDRPGHDEGCFLAVLSNGAMLRDCDDFFQVCPNHDGNFDCNPFCALCEGEQVFLVRGV